MSSEGIAPQAWLSPLKIILSYVGSKAEVKVKVTSFEKWKLWGLKVIFKVRIVERASIKIQVPSTWIQI
jgi:hypothetical protein